MSIILSKRLPVVLTALGKSLKQRSTSLALLAAVGGSMILSACSSGNANLPQANLPGVSSVGNSQPDQGTQRNVIRIGYQKYGTLSILKARGNLEQALKPQGVSVQWVQFPAGPQLLEALNTGSIDFGHTGEAPPIFAQAAGAPLVYIAHEPPNPKGEAILVPKDSPIRDVADLKGKKVALNKGANVHYLLVQALATRGLKYSDIQPVYLPPADARPAFEQRSVDAWAIWDPFFTAAKRATGARVLVDGTGLAANREFYLAAKPFAEQHRDRVKVILDEAQEVDDWAKSKPREVATLLSPQLGIDVPTLEEVAKRRPYGVQPIKPDVVAYQQRIADTFLQLKLLPKPLNVEEVVQAKRN